MFDLGSKTRALTCIKECNMYLDTVNKQGHCLDVYICDYTVRGKCTISDFSTDHEMGQPFQLVYAV